NASAAQDGASNNNSASNIASVTFDASAPTVVVTAPASPTSASPMTFSIAFNEAVTGLTSAGFTVTGGTIGALSGSGASYFLTITPSAPGAVTVQVDAAAAQDASLNDSLASNVASATFDSDSPSVTLSTASAIVSGAFSVTATFSEAVTGVALTNFAHSN